MHCIGIDPGPVRSAVARVAYEDGRFRLVWGTWRPLDLIDNVEHCSWLTTAINDMQAEDRGLFAVETVVGVAFTPARVGQLIETSGVANALLMLGRVLGVQTERIPAGDGKVLTHEPLPKLPKRRKGDPPRPKREAAKRVVKGWRGELCRSASATDEQIAVVINGLVADDGVARTNEERMHLNDAIGVAVVAIARRLGLTLTLPGDVERALYQQQAADKAAKAAKRAVTMAKKREARSAPPVAKTRGKGRQRSTGALFAGVGVGG